MLFNIGKCKFLHTGHGIEDAQYTMGGTVLNTTVKEKDLGLTISADLKVSDQCGIEFKWKGFHVPQCEQVVGRSSRANNQSTSAAWTSM